MRHIKNVLLAFALLSLFIPLPLAAQAKGTILIASEKTGFKEMLVAEMESLFTEAGYTVVQARHSKGWLDKYRASDYSAVFITNSGVNSKVRPWVSEWIEKNNASNVYILLHTTQIRHWKVIASVDAVTSASKKNDVKLLAREYFDTIIGKIEKNGRAQ